MSCLVKNRLVYLAALHSRSCHTVVAKSAVVTQPLNFLNGKRMEPVNTDKQQQFPLQYPATGEVLKTVQSSGAVDVDIAVTAAKNGQKIWASMSGFERGQVLKRAADICRSKQEELARAETFDTGKPIWEARFDIQGCSDSVEYYGGLASTISGEFLQLSKRNFAYTIREPLGVVGGIGAWNYPFQMATWKSAPALACGNAFVFKPSQMTPLSAVMLGEIYKEAGLPDGCYNVVQGEAETGQLLCNHPSIDKMTFTGSVPVGSKVMEACAKDIKHVTLELGGKSPLIIFEDSHLDNAVTGAMLANFLTQGQVCSNGTRVFVQKKILNQFLEKLVERTKKMKIGDPFAEDTTVGATISRQQADKVLSYIDIAKKEGATVLCGGEEVTPEPKYSKGQFISPCVLSNCHDDMTAVKDEIFGSVMSVLEFDSEEEVIDRANNTEFGLAGGVFTRDLCRAHRVIAQMQAGSLYVNNYNVYPVGVPFGGYKKSGIGRENGPEAIDYYSQVKSVYVEMNDVEAPF
ncbi:4-trimethylaminobutyraldehyde dehydrogenase-like isoform X1 [Mercenaria mercenaria]|uniref:4-trimethylaminobutyraldehyde dehydrogenase-like isoform X1 n=2 Tax=Mercenaria mercenaria TaxID=6596 RepID=UPI00234F90BE|nr:4-trimethylaminobutyraldehyde dehydrogenase-like isoform X1 [Mercenaria mercenaria]XP_045168037.2 4-trimethylaminobutyraldehyde dehydrogenase-like isoform X1 [Mercenaria mercenaria]